LLGFGLLLEEVPGILGQVEKGLLHEPADHPGIGATAGHRSGFPVVLPDLSEESLSHAVVGAFGEILLSAGVVASPLLLDGVDVEDSLFLAVLGDVAGRGAAGEVDQEADLVDENLVQGFSEIVRSEGHLDELDPLVVVWKMDGFGVYDGHFVELEVPLDQRDRSSPDRPVSHYAHVVDVTVNWIAFHLLFKVIIHLSENKEILKDYPQPHPYTPHTNSVPLHSPGLGLLFPRLTPKRTQFEFLFC